VFNQGPRRLRDYVEHRARNHHGHAAIRAETGYAAATLGLGRVARASLQVASDRPAEIPTLCLAVLLEGLARGVGRARHWRSPVSGVWRPISSAKLPFSADALTVVVGSASVELAGAAPDLAGDHL